MKKTLRLGAVTLLSLAGLPMDALACGQSSDNMTKPRPGIQSRLGERGERRSNVRARSASGDGRGVRDLRSSRRN